MEGKYRKIKISVIIIMAGFLFLQMGTILFGKTDDRFVNVFASTVDGISGDIAGIEGHIEVSASTDNKYESREQKEEVLKEMAKKFGVEDNYSITSTKEDSVDRMTLTKYFDKRVLSIAIADISCADDKDEKMQYMFWELKLEENLDKILEYREKMCEEMKSIGVTPVSNISLSSNFSGKVSTEKKDRITKQLLSYMKARVVEEEKNENTYIVYGYSPEVKESISYTDEKLNLNIAFDYDEQKDETYLHLAMPYIRCSY